MNNTIEKLITLLTEQLENAGDISTGQGIKQDMNQQAEDVSGQPDGFRKDPVKELHDHEDRVAEKTAKETKEVVSKLLTYHRKATKPLSTEILKTIEKSNVLLRKVNDGIDKQSNEIKESYSRIEQLNAAQADENRVNLALLEKLVNNTAPKPRKIREDTLNVKITNFDDFKGGEGDSKQVAKLTPRSSKSEGADWVKWLAGAGLIAYILKEAFKGFDFGQWIKGQFQEMFERGPDENISGGVHGTKWAARMLKPILAWGTKAGIKATWATIKGVTGISTLQKMTGIGKGPTNTPEPKPKPKPGPKPKPNTPEPKPKPKPGPTPKPNTPGKTVKPNNLKFKNVPKTVPISTVGSAIPDAADTAKSSAAAAKTMGAKGGISLGRRLVSNTPYLGIGISTAMGAWRQATGDQTGANLEYLSAALNAGSGFGGPAGLASMASSFAVDGYIVYRDWKRSKHWEELMEANEGYLERVKILRELTDGGKSVSDLSTDELKSILGEENWEKFRKNRGSKNLRYMAEKGVREFRAELDAEKESREKMVQEVMDSMGGAFSEADRPAIQAILMSQALAYSKEGQSDAIREQYAEDFSNIIQNSGKMEDLMQEYASFSRDTDIGKRTSGRRNLFKGNIALEWGKGYDPHVVLDAEGKNARLVKNTSGGLEEREYVYDKDGNIKTRKIGNTVYKLMKKTGRRLTKDDPLLAEFYRKRDEHMAPMVGKRTADSLKAAGYWPAFLEQMPELEGKPLADQEYALGMMVVKGWSLENTMGGLLGVNLKGPKHTKAFLDKVAKMAEGVKTGEGISRGYVTNVMKDRIRHAQSGTKAISKDGTGIFTGYLPTAGGHVGIQSMMTGETPVPEDVKQWFVESVNSPPGSLQRQIVENMDHDVRRKLAGWEHMDSTGKRRFDEYWNDREAAEFKYEKLMQKYASLTDAQVEDAKSQGAWNVADQINLEEARFHRADSKARKEFISLAGYGAGHYGGMAYGGVHESEEGLYFQRLAGRPAFFVGMHEGEDYNLKAEDLAALDVSSMAELTPEQLEFAQALQSKEKGQAYYLRNIKGREGKWVAPKLPAGRYIDVNQVEQFVAPTPLDSYPLSPDEEYLPLQNLLRDSRSTDPNAGAELLLKEQVDETKQMNEAIRQFMSESNPTNQSSNTQVNNSNINTTITTEGATQIEKNKGAFRSSPGSSIWTGTRTY